MSCGRFCRNSGSPPLFESSKANRVQVSPSAGDEVPAACLPRPGKRILRKLDYRPDKAEKATQTVLEQAELLSEGWALA